MLLFSLAPAILEETNPLMIGFATLGIIFLMVILLGLQIQISTLTRRIDELVDEMRKRED